MTKRVPFRYFEMRPEITQLAVLMDVGLPLSVRIVEDCSMNGAS